MIIIIVFIHHIKVETIFTRGGISLPLLRWVLWIWLKCICTCGLLFLSAPMHACAYKCTSVNTRKTLFDFSLSGLARS